MSALLPRPDFGIRNPQQASPNGSVYLHPGQIFATSDPCAIMTIVGSCVAVCLWDPVLKVGGMNHYLLPHGADNGLGSPRFGNVAMRTLIDRLLALGSDKRNLQAKVFGGACVIEAMRRSEHHLGAKNVQVAHKLLEDAGISVVGDDTGGRQGRKLIFHVADGTAWIKRL